MFDTTSHDFGTVARASDVKFEFPLTNAYQEDVHIAGVRSSCGCTSPKITKPTLKTHETGSILAVFDTRSFLGSKDATVTVTFDRPYYAEVQLHVSGLIRSDVVLDPSRIDLGSVQHGAESDKSVSIKYAGRSDWKILGVKVANPDLTARVVEQYRSGGQIGYQLTVAVKESAPAGQVHDQVYLVTNDQGTTQIPVSVVGRVVPAVSVSPSSLFLGVLQPGQTVTKQLIVRAKQPFRVVRVDCDDDCFEFKVSKDDDARLLHMIPVTFVAGDKPGKISQRIHIETDLGDGTDQELVAYAQITSPEK